MGYGNGTIADWIWLTVLVAGGAPLVWNIVRGMVRGTFAADVVATLAIVTTVAMHEHFAGAIVVLMQSGGEALEAYGLGRASSSLAALAARAPRIAHRKLDGGLEEIDVAEVCVGDSIMVRPGDLIPVDGTLAPKPCRATGMHRRRTTGHSERTLRSIAGPRVSPSSTTICGRGFPS